MKTHKLFRFAAGNPEGTRRKALKQGAAQCSKMGVPTESLTEIVTLVTCGNCRKSMVGMARVTPGTWDAWLELQREKAGN